MPRADGDRLVQEATSSGRWVEVVTYFEGLPGSPQRPIKTRLLFHCAEVTQDGWETQYPLLLIGLGDQAELVIRLDVAGSPLTGTVKLLASAVDAQDPEIFAREVSAAIAQACQRDIEDARHAKGRRP